ncbi:Hypothetical predicted protein [Paramuricea clavata]|uniref:Uncharacterized protein n=1 Tax=Paramuricea clavata TaxID=317549 RepID=A0A7D9LEI5_PARCT|nr:Hypothetical predicted protein [Paramuricea clavata]
MSMIFFLIGVPDENPKSSSKSNTGVIIGTVAAAVIVIVAAIFIVGCFLFGRLKKQRRRDIGPIQNAAYEGDRHADIMPQVFHSESRPPAYSEIGLPQVFYSQSDYGQPAKYHSSTTVSIGANFQSANEAYPNQHHRAHNENAQRDAPHNLNSNPANESMYEEVS